MHPAKREESLLWVRWGKRVIETAQDAPKRPQEAPKKPQEAPRSPQEVPKRPHNDWTERPADGLDQVQHVVHRTNSTGRSAPPGAGTRACAGRCADGKSAHFWEEGSGPEVEVLVQSALAEHVGHPCADTRRMLIAPVDGTFARSSQR